MPVHTNCLAKLSSQECPEKSSKKISSQFSLADLYNGRGLAYYHNSQYKEAVEDFIFALKLAENKYTDITTTTTTTTTTATTTITTSSTNSISPPSSTAKYDLTLAMYHGNLGLALFYIGEHEKSIAEFSVAISLGLNDPLIYSMRGSAYQLIGRLEEASRDRSHAHSMDRTIIKEIFPYPLPQELIFKILDFLSPITLAACKVTCKKWNTMIEQHVILWIGPNNSATSAKDQIQLYKQISKKS